MAAVAAGGQLKLSSGTYFSAPSGRTSVARPYVGGPSSSGFFAGILYLNLPYLSDIQSVQMELGCAEISYSAGPRMRNAATLVKPARFMRGISPR